MIQLNVNTDAVKAYTKKLEQLNRSAFPVAVRGALNNAAFDVKQNTMPKTSKEDFENRQPNFFKANSTVNMATGFDVRTMKAEVGFMQGKLKGPDNFSVKDLEQQEEGGTIGGKTFIPTIYARKGNNHSQPVRANARLEKIKKGKIVDSKKVNALSKKQRFFVAADMAGKGGFVIHSGVLWRITDNLKNLRAKKSVISGGQRGNGQDTTHFDFKSLVDKNPLYSVSKGRKVKVKATHFMERASTQSAKKIDDYYVEQAEKQFAKVLK